MAVAFAVASGLGGKARLFYLDPSAAVTECDAVALREGSPERTEALEARYRRWRAKEAERCALDLLDHPDRPEVLQVPA